MAAITLSASSLRSLKNALRDYFPTIKSSHLSEALASTLGFQTHAALLARAANPVDDSGHGQLDAQRFISRLHQLGNSVDPAFSFEMLEFERGDAVPTEFSAAITRLLALEANPEERWPEIYALRRRCATLFAQTFGLGYAETREDDKRVVKQFGKGVDHKACVPGWGGVVNSHRPRLEFPGADHQVGFYERLPLSDGRFVEYCTAVVSMPYVGPDGTVPRLDDARELARRVGWTCTVHSEWAWYAVKATALVLFRRSTPHLEMERAWETSFKRWLFENKSRLTKGVRPPRRYVVSDAMDCEHFPLDVQSFDDCRERYLKEFAYRLFYDEDDSMTNGFKKLFEKWQAERLAA